MALWLDKNDYDFETEDQKLSFIQDTFFDHMFRCPNCGEAYTDEDGALNVVMRIAMSRTRNFREEMQTNA